MAAKGKGSKKACGKVDAYKEMFKQFDKDKSGWLSVTEFRELLKAGGCNMSDRQIAESFLFFDSDGGGDKKISFEEFVKGMDAILTFVAKVSQLFAELDADGSGFLDRNELKTLLNQTGQSFTDDEVTQILRSADVNGDGRISLDEFVNACC